MRSHSRIVVPTRCIARHRARQTALRDRLAGPLGLSTRATVNEEPPFAEAATRIRLRSSRHSRRPMRVNMITERLDRFVSAAMIGLSLK